jgi:hypothetical protein
MNNTMFCSYAEGALVPFQSKILSWTFFGQSMLYLAPPVLYAAFIHYLVRSNSTPKPTLKDSTQPSLTNLDHVNAEIVKLIHWHPLTVSQLHIELDGRYPEDELRNRLYMLKANNVVIKLERYPQEPVWAA